MTRRLVFSIATLLLLTCACGPSDPEVLLSDGQKTLTTADQAVWIAKLASDEFEGRGPSSAGEEKTIAYLEAEFRRLGLQPGAAGGYLQEVPLVDITVQGDPALAVSGKGRNLSLSYADDAVFWTKQVREESALVNSELVFVGYGIVAPEYGWNDYAGLDMKGKTALILVNDPGYASPEGELFNGKTMTYYGRWTYKYEEAARQGAAGALILHETGPAGYVWDTVRNSWTGPQFDLVRPDDNASRVDLEGWLTSESSSTLFEAAGLRMDELKTAAAQPGFKAVPLGLQVSTQFQNAIRRSTSHNVAAMIPGSQRPDEYVIYMAHWDHFGRDASLEGDQIYNGALDNATGVAALLGLAKAFASLPAPQRSLLFLAVTAEEQGLLGSAYYGASPLVPAAQTVAAINMDGMNLNGPMKDVTVIGYGNSELDDYVQEAAKKQNRRVRSDPEPEKGYYYRSDHFSLAKYGIPALYCDSGIDSVEHGEAWTMSKREEYIAKNYHRVSDEYDPAWDLSGAVQDLQLLMRIGFRLANSGAWPNWREGTEFRALRDQQRKP